MVQKAGAEVAGPVMDISVLNGMVNPQRNRAWADFMFCFIYLFTYRVERVLAGVCPDGKM